MNNREPFGVSTIRSRGMRRRAPAYLFLVVLVAQTLLQLTPVALATQSKTAGARAVVPSAPAQVTVSLDAGLTGAAYTGFNSSPTHPNAQNLTAAGTTDWRIWGENSTSLAGDDRKVGGAGISDLTNIDFDPSIPLRSLGNLGLTVDNGPSTVPFSFAWSNGTPVASASVAKAGLQHNNFLSSLEPGYGFSFTVPATTVTQTLRVWVSAHHGTGRLTATLAGVDHTDTGVSGGQNHGGVYTIDFTGDGTPGQTLEVSFVLDSAVSPTSTLDSDGLPSTEANVVIYAAALSQPPVAAPVLYQATPTGVDQALISGRLTAAPSTSYQVTVKSGSGCVEGSLGSESSTLGTFTTTTDATGNSNFQQTFLETVLSTYVTAQVTGPGGASSAPSACITGGPDNDTWPRAALLSLTAGTGSATGYVDDEGRARWYKVAIQPGQRLHVNLADLPADYDMFVFTDILKAFNAATGTPDLTKLSAEFAPSAFSPSAFSPSAFSPSAFSPSAFSPSAFSPSAFSPGVFSPSAFSPSAFSPSAFSPSAFSPSAFSPSAFSPSAFSPSAFSPSAFSPSAFSADTYASAQIRSLIGGSATAGVGGESVVVDTWNNTGEFYIRVSGKNGAFSLDSTFSLTVSLDGSVCDGVTPQSGAFTAPAGNYQTLILADLSRMPETLSGNSVAAKGILTTRLSTFAARPEIAGKFVDLSDTSFAGKARIEALNGQADLHKSCMYAKNLVASAIRDVVIAYRTANTNLKYVVIIGGDGAIPFFRYPDQALLGPEASYAAPVFQGTASNASLRANFVLGQDAYGSRVDLSLHADAFPIPDLPVGRLVETAAEATGMIDAYLTTSGGTVPAPTSALVAGYDFLEDAANSVVGDLSAGMGTAGHVDSLISDFDVAPQTLCTGTLSLPDCSWNAAALRNGLLGSRHDLLYLAGHFSANSALAADFATTLLTTELDSSNVNLQNSIVFSAGCHSGYNVVDPDAVPGGSVDWAQAFARKKATLIAGTGYQYGDTDFLEYSERIYAEFAHQLRVGSGPVSVGTALMQSKKVYLATTQEIRGLHHKALLEATLFGLPMLSVNLPGRVPADPSSSTVTLNPPFGTDPAAELELRSADLEINLSVTGPDPDLEAHDVLLDNVEGGTVTATYYSGPDGVVTNPGAPAVPLVSEDVSVGGKVLRGVGFMGGSYTDQEVVPLTGAPADPEQQIRGVHSAFASPVFFPMRLWNVNYFDALTGGPTRLLVTPAQHRSAGGVGAATLRLYTGLDLELFYSSYTGAAAASGAPTITGVAGSASGGNVTFTASAVGDPRAGMQKVWVTYTGHGNQWTSVQLEQDATDSTLWSKTIALSPTPGRSIEFLVQALNGVGLVSMDDNLGRLYAIGETAQTISFQPIATQSLGSSSFALLGAASSGLPVSFASTGPCSISGSVLTVTGAGTCTVTANQAGNASYAAAAPVQRSIVSPLGQTITFAPLPDRLLSDPDFNVVATSSSGLPVSFSASGPCTVTGNQVHVTGGGTCTITASQAGNATNAPAASVSRSFGIRWPFAGFFQPVDNAPTVNIVTAGSAVPIKFSLGGNRGLNILAANSPIVTTIPCSTALPTDVIETTVAASSSGLQYDAASGQYSFVWKTTKGATGCRQVNIKLADGTDHIALFKFK